MYIAILAVLILLYRMFKYYKKTKKFKVINHEQDFNIEYGKGYLEPGNFEFILGGGNNLYSFYIIYGELLLIGKYTYPYKLEDADLQGMYTLYNVENKLEETGITFYEYRKGLKDVVNFYFVIQLVKDNPFIR